MKQITEQWIASLAPNASALQNARKICQKGGFVSLSAAADQTFYMGQCAGSGKSNYTTSADFIDPEAPVFRCSCPSRQFPCKHSLALLLEMTAGRDFAACDIPESILDKRAKKEARTEKQKEKKSEPPKVNKAARTKKLKKQLDGLSLAQKMIDEMLGAGLGTLSGNSVKVYQDLAKQLGDYYLPGPQTYIKRVALEIEQLQQDGQDSHYERAAHLLMQLHALTGKARAYLSEKLETGGVEEDDSVLFEALGGVWQLDKLQQLGLCKQNARLAQLSFDVYLDKARGEYVDLGYWADLDSGEVSATYNYRPLKALKYVRQDDTVFGLTCVPTLTYYPGTMNRRIRWEQAAYEPLTGEHLRLLREKAHPALAPAVKAAKNELKNTLSDGLAAQLVAFAQIGRTQDGGFALQDSQGATILLRDRPGGSAQTTDRLSMLPDAQMLQNQVLFGAFFYDSRDCRICIEPYSLVTAREIVRLLY